MRRFFGLGAAVLFSSFLSENPPLISTPDHFIRGSSKAYSRKGWGSRPVAGGGQRERERRMRQILAGQLKAENGLDVGLSERLWKEGRI